MPEVIVSIKWDKPEEKEWLNPFNIKLCLENTCKNTRFEVKDFDSGVIALVGGGDKLEKPLFPHSELESLLQRAVGYIMTTEGHTKQVWEEVITWLQAPLTQHDQLIA